MTQDIKTLELAKLYEHQGYFKEAFDYYAFLDNREPSDETKAGLARMEKRVGKKGQGASADNTLSVLVEKWVKVLVLKQRVDTMKKMAARRLSA